ncbi:major facilitator superfamily domain-containing protein [Halteromyces radiatus]|uniref:major facilitator superfamily domain-containing protein n=1 Tax=Halteromyces radiatus TaxID=101107 RepID=UPI002220509F|nr:major facilitator superfamily domain-containing protein [Halteromyces radiatus]KAI8096311.1 major facilitator superfamily domain-containing protein [Halteromyces radiatus]
MNVQQNEISKSYTDSLNSYLNDDDIDEFNPHQRRLSHQTYQSLRSTDGSSFLPTTTTTTNTPYYQDNNNNNDDDEMDDEESLLTTSSPTPLPKMQMFIISIMLFSDPLTSTILLPFIYFMLKDFHLSDDEKEIGTYAGWITSVFFLAQFCTAILWGRISDRYGRRPVLLTGLIGNSISSCLFGLSRNLWWAVCARAFCGIVNGNGGVARSMISEITDATNRAKAFSIFGFCWGIGMIGGFLCKPAEHFPSLFGNSAFFIKYPYFLPCFVSSLGSFVGYLIGFFYLKESNPTVIARQQQQQQQDLYSYPKNDGITAHQEDNETTALLSTNSSPVKKSVTHPMLAIMAIGKTSVITIATYSLFAFHAMVFDEVLPLYFAAPTHVGGLGSTAQELAKMLSICGLWQLLSQFYIFPWINKRYDTLDLTRCALLLFTVSYFFLPELSTYREWLISHVGSETSGKGLYLLRAGYLTLLLTRIFGNCLAFTGLMVMVSNSAAEGMLGTVNGVLQSCLSFVRAFGPTVGGTLWSLSLKNSTYPFDRHLVYYLIALLSFINWIQSYWIPRSLALGGKRH